MYEGLDSDDLATTLNLRLDGIVEAYASVEEPAVARSRANLKVLHLIQAADQATEQQRENLLRGAKALNDWLIDEEGERAPHLINRWQIQSRTGLLTGDSRRAIRDLKVQALRGETSSPALVVTCCAILLGDSEELEHSFDSLSSDDQALVKKWPIWHLARESRLVSDARTKST